MTPVIGFLGGGNMAGALLGGLLQKLPGANLHVVDHNVPKLEKLAQRGVTTHETLGDWVTACDLFVLAVKPQVMKEALVPVLPLLKKGGAALSIAAGIEGAVLRKWLAGYPVMRAMPNTPALVGADFLAFGFRKEPNPSTLNLLVSSWKPWGPWFPVKRKRRSMW